tara:strand:- start:26693 stop:29245 length:2553 start_codon:yes stop_codon:yes gene_type:complete
MACCRRLALLLVSLLWFAAQPALADEVLIDGLAWRQLTDTAGAGLSWNDVASVCPLNETPCNGTVNGVDFTGWTWASANRVNRMLDSVTGLRFPVEPFDLDSSVELFFDTLDAVFISESGSGSFSYGLYALPEAPADGLVDVLEIRDATTNAGSDRMILQEAAVSDTDIASIFSRQPFGVFLVRDPELELCNNGIDDNGNGDIDALDDGCQPANPIIDDLEWRQVTDTQGIDIRDVTTVCPGGGNPCDGMVAGVDFTGWTWASSEDVVGMINTLTGITIGNTAVQYPAALRVTAPVFDKFSPTQTLFTNWSIYAFTYNSRGEFGNGDYPTISFFVDPASCNNGIDDDLDGRTDNADVNCLSTEWFVITDQLGPTANDILGTLGGGLLQNNFYGYFLYREPILVTPESCDNRLDDDGDGLVDGQDADDCDEFAPLPFIVSCLHDPVYSGSDSAEFTISARALDEDGIELAADTIEIWTSADTAQPQVSASNTAQAAYAFTPGESFSYNCSATQGEARYSSGWRQVTVGDFDSTWPAIPILVNGPIAEKIDIVFFHDEDEYTGQDDPEFVRDVALLLKGGYFSIPWFVRNQSYFNFWLGDAAANSGPDPDDDDPSNGIRCLREGPENFGRDYAFADSGGIVHREDCRDNAGGGRFTVTVELERLQTAAHETGHRPFGLADEYCCDGGYSTRVSGGAPYHNMFADEDDCVAAAEEREYDSSLCRGFVESHEDADDWWLFEPSAASFSPEQRDLMQGTGCESLDTRADCRGVAATTSGPATNPNGQVACASTLDTYEGNTDVPGSETYWLCTASGDAATAEWQEFEPEIRRLEPRSSELDRMQWYLSECDAQRC